MAIKPIRNFSKYTRESLSILATAIKVARKEKGMTQVDVSERAGIGRNLLSRIEKGDPVCEIGVVFEVAYIVGVPLFSQSQDSRNQLHANLNDKSALLPDRLRKSKVLINDDF